MSYDLVIKNGSVIDGSGAPRYRADVAVADGRIAAIGRVDGKARTDDRCRRARRDARFRRRPYAHGCAGVLGSDRLVLVLSRRHDGGDGQLRVHACAVQIRRRRSRVPQSRARRRHLARLDARRHQVELGVVPAIPRHRRAVAERHQLRRLHGSLGVAHLRDGRARVQRNGERRRSEENVRVDAGRAASRCDRLLDVAHAQSHHRPTSAPWRAASPTGAKCAPSSTRWAN